jgi:hypothetical protein
MELWSLSTIISHQLGITLINLIWSLKRLSFSENISELVQTALKAIA